MYKLKLRLLDEMDEKIVFKLRNSNFVVNKKWIFRKLKNC